MEDSKNVASTPFMMKMETDENDSIEDVAAFAVILFAQWQRQVQFTYRQITLTVGDTDSVESVIASYELQKYGEPDKKP